MPTLVYSDVDGIDRTYALTGEPVLVGRAVECQIHSADPRLSRQHARFFADQGMLWVEDLGSSNGVFVGANKVQRAPVPPGEIVLIGSLILRAAEDVRLLTRPLWNLSENRFRRLSAPYYTQPPIVRFVWGKAWNIAGVIAAVSERLEYFNERGVPQRSWIRLMLLRTEEENFANQGFAQSEIAPRDIVIPARNTDDVLVHEVTGAGDSAERLDEIAQRYYGDASMWRRIASANGITDPMALVAGTLLRIPPIGGGS